MSESACSCVSRKSGLVLSSSVRRTVYLSEAANMVPEKKGRKKHTRGKKKHKEMKLAEKPDGFFDGF
jgi:hypothetical protein